MRTRVAHKLSGMIGGAEAPHTRSQFLEAALEPGQEAAITIPAGFSPRDYAVYLLHVAAEVEHALLVEYLFAAYSLGGSQVPEEHRATVHKWQVVLLGIAKEEMAHFVTVQNVLRLLGAPLNFERDDFPWDVAFAPFAFSLEPLSRASLARYVYVESPETWPKDAAQYQAEIAELAEKDQPAKPNRVGKLYTLMMNVLNDSKLIPDTAFQAATMPYQASWDEWGRGYRDGARGSASPGDETPDLVLQRAYSRASAVAALKAVAEQGEAADTDAATKQRSHFRRFLDIWTRFPKEGEWSAVRDLCPNPTTVSGIDGLTFIEGEQTRQWAHLLNLKIHTESGFVRPQARRLEGESANFLRGKRLPRPPNFPRSGCATRPRRAWCTARSRRARRGRTAKRKTPCS